ncbi:MAG TPA: M23/M56 family metallopeptidase [Chryseosolibacter sp.]|nr:M23/M56 family metallopeptidase [Chryseosolibacter sp.]
MTPVLLYLLKVSACTAVFFGLYYFTLRNYTFHTANRICIIAMILCSFFVPSLPVNTTLNGAVGTLVQLKDAGPGDFETISPTDGGLPVSTTGAFPFVLTFYLLGVTVFTFRFVRSLVTLYRLNQQSAVEYCGGLRIRRTRAQASFTFLNTIYLPQGQTDETIVRHEQVHVTQYHWADLLLMEFAVIVLWFNPVIFLVKRELRLQHEFLADQAVIRQGTPFEEYAQCLIRNMQATTLSMRTAISPLYTGSLKKRILMMTKKRTSRCLTMAYLLMIPAFAALLTSFGRKNTQPETIAITMSIQTPPQIPDIAPVDFSKVTRIVMYGDRIHPATRQLKKHTGIDFELPAGSDIVATGDGVIVVQQYGELEGNYVVIKHDETHLTRYYHLEKALVKKGDKVHKGQVIGLVGSTGILSTTPHLHYEVIKNGTDVDPKAYLPVLPN